MWRAQEVFMAGGLGRAGRHVTAVENTPECGAQGAAKPGPWQSGNSTHPRPGRGEKYLLLAETPKASNTAILMPLTQSSPYH
jgi:hypothetical protein